MKLLLLGLDGLRSDCLLLSNSPNLKKLLMNSSYSLDTCIDTITVSGPSWSTILSGKLGNETQVFDNDTVLDSNFKWKCSNIFKQLNNLGIKNKAFISHWSGVKHLAQDSQKIIFTQNVTPTEADIETIDKTLKEVKETTNTKQDKFIFTYLPSIDETGHVHGFSLKSKGYIESIEILDKHLGPLIGKCTENGWNIVVTTDHGGYHVDDLITTHHNHEDRYHLDYKGMHNVRNPQSSRAFQIYYGLELQSSLGYDNNEILEHLSNKNVCPNIINCFINNSRLKKKLVLTPHTIPLHHPCYESYKR